MFVDSRQLTNTPFESFDTQVKMLLIPSALAAGTFEGDAIELPAAGYPCRALFIQMTGAAVDNAVSSGYIEQANDGGGPWETIATFTEDVSEDTIQKVYATVTKQYVRYSSVVTGDDSPEIQSSAVVIF